MRALSARQLFTWLGGRDWCAERDELFALRARFVPCWFACLRFIFGYARVRTPPLNPQRSCSWCRFLGFVNAMSSLWVFFFHPNRTRAYATHTQRKNAGAVRSQTQTLTQTIINPFGRRRRRARARPKCRQPINLRRFCLRPREFMCIMWCRRNEGIPSGLDAGCCCCCGVVVVAVVDAGAPTIFTLILARLYCVVDARALRTSRRVLVFFFSCVRYLTARLCENAHMCVCLISPVLRSS